MVKNELIKFDSQEAKDILQTIEKLRKDGHRIEKERHADILFITGCTIDKDGNEDDDGMLAFERYTGGASTRMLNFFGSFHQERKRLLDLYVLSAGYGFIPADSSILKYDVSFNNVDSKLRKEMAKKLEIRKNFRDLLKLGYKLIILRLGTKYIKALNDDLKNNDELFYDVPNGTEVVYLKPKSTGEILLQAESSQSETIKLLKTSGFELKKVSDCKLSNDAQDTIWSEFFKKNKDKSTDEIIKKIKNVKSVEELLK